jgi:hypothetical protein
MPSAIIIPSLQIISAHSFPARSMRLNTLRAGVGGCNDAQWSLLFFLSDPLTVAQCPRASVCQIIGARTVSSLLLFKSRRQSIAPDVGARLTLINSQLCAADPIMKIHKPT